MNEHRTMSIRQRVPVILAVTAASYGLPLPGHAQRSDRVGDAREACARAFAMNTIDRLQREVALRD